MDIVPNIFKAYFAQEHTLLARSIILDLSIGALAKRALLADETYLVCFILEDISGEITYTKHVMVGSIFSQYEIPEMLTHEYIKNVLKCDIVDERYVRTFRHDDCVWLKGDGESVEIIQDYDFYWIDPTTVHAL